MIFIILMAERQSVAENVHSKTGTHLKAYTSVVCCAEMETEWSFSRLKLEHTYLVSNPADQTQNDFK